MSQRRQRRRGDERHIDRTEIQTDRPHCRSQLRRVGAPRRAVLTVLGTVLGIGALVATLGISKTSGNQIVGRLDALAATEIVATPRAVGRLTPNAIPWNAQQQLEGLNGGVAAGTLADIAIKGTLIRAVPVNDPLG